MSSQELPKLIFGEDGGLAFPGRGEFDDAVGERPSGARGSPSTKPVKWRISWKRVA